MPATGGEATWLARGISPHWSPDGQRLVLITWSEGKPHLATIPAAGGPPVFVGDPRDGGIWPRWSPDGGRILVSRTQVLTLSDIYLTDVSGLIRTR